MSKSEEETEKEEGEPLKKELIETDLGSRFRGCNPNGQPSSSTCM